MPEGAAAHYPGTAWPGEGSNTYVYAHAREGHFLELWQVRTGDVVDVDLLLVERHDAIDDELAPR